MKTICWSFAITLLLLISQVTYAQPPFQQGPGEIGRILHLSGKVIGEHRMLEEKCVLVLADRGEKEEMKGLGGNGRFFLCNTSYSMGDYVEGKMQQTGIRRAKAGAVWRPFPVYKKL